MEIKFHYVVYKNDKTYLTEGTEYLETSRINMYKLVLFGCICDSRDEIAGLEEKAKKIVRKNIYNDYNLWYNQIEVEIDFDFDYCDDIYNNKFIEDFVKWYLKEVYAKNNENLYISGGSEAFIKSTISYFEDIYDGDLKTWIWDTFKKIRSKYM